MQWSVLPDSTADGDADQAFLPASGYCTSIGGARCSRQRSAVCLLPKFPGMILEWKT